LGGLDLEPKRHDCNPGFFRSLFSFHKILWAIVVGAVIYFGWPMIEAIILALPIENLNGVRDSLSNVYNKVLSFFKGLPGAVKGRDKKAEMQSQDLSSYKKDFDTKPDTLLEDDDDEEDVGKIAKHSDNLDFNSDEKEENIAPVQKRSKDVPKLKKPNK